VKNQITIIKLKISEQSKVALKLSAMKLK